MEHSNIILNQMPATHPHFWEVSVQKKRAGKKNFGFLLLFACLFLETATVSAQVTVGSRLEAARGALLDLKTQLPDATRNVTSTSGGLLLPRVELSDPKDFSLIPNLNTDLKKYTGLLVYNLNVDETLSLEKGIYQWDGEKWRKLNKITKTENVTVKKIIYQATAPDASKTVPIGIFEFRMETNINDSFVYPQFKLADGLAPQSVYWHVNEYWDNYPNEEATNLKNSGYASTLKEETVNSSVWSNCKNLMSHLERNEFWLADLTNNHMYQVQFAIISNGTTNNTYSIIAKRY
jgi:hypothetical protein